MELPGSAIRNSLVFAINGEKFEVSEIHPSTTLLEFLRLHTPFKGAKLSCGEGFYFFFSDTPCLFCFNVLAYICYCYLVLLCFSMLVGFPIWVFFFFDGYPKVSSPSAEFPLSSCTYCLPLILLSRFYIYLFTFMPASRDLFFFFFL